MHSSDAPNPYYSSSHSHAKAPPPFEHLIFDLDDTLLDTSGLLIPIKDTPYFIERLSLKLPLLPGAEDNLNYLKTKYTLHLLTQGRPELQQMKIESLGIAHLFTAICIIDPQKNEQKSDFFSRFLQHQPQVNPQSVLSIGNRKSTDLGPAKRQGFRTCWFAYGEHQNEPVQSPEEIPDFIVTHHFEMIKVCQL